MGIRLGIGGLKIGQRSGTAAVPFDWSSYCTPLNWDWELPVTIQQKGSLFQVDPAFDLETYADIAVSKTYYVSTTGLDTNNGLTLATAFRTIDKAFSMPDYDEIIINEGVYFWSDSNSAAAISFARNVKIKGVGNVYWTTSLYNQLGGEWSASGSHYSNTLVVEPAIFDAHVLTARGGYTKYTKVANEAAVDATAGTYCFSGGTLYVRCIDDRVPDADLRLYYASGIALVQDNRKVYIENINFENYAGTSFKNSSAAGGTKIYLKKCSFINAKYSVAGGLVVSGIDEAILQNCNASYNGQDGFYYRTNATLPTNVIEIDCIGCDNGVAGGTAYNGSTGHSCTVVRVNGEYSYSRGNNIHDITASKTLCLGVKSNHSEYTGGGGGNFVCGNGDDSVMWCDSCISSDSDIDYRGRTVTTKLYKKNCTGDAVDAGNIEAY